MPNSKLLSYLRLMRFGNVFTAIADIAMGFLVVNHGFAPIPVFVCLCVASSLLFLSGMILNDVYDIDVDREQRPQRPLPAGEVSISTATKLGYGFLISGVLIAALAGWLPQLLDEKWKLELPWRSGLIGLLLAISIVAYDKILKKTALGPVAMGACRFFNVLLGMSATTQMSGPVWGAYFPLHCLVIAAGIGTYIIGVTIFARTEAVESSKAKLIAGVGVMMFGVGILATISLFDLNKLDFPGLSEQTLQFWPGILLLISVGIMRSALMAVVNPHPARVQAAVKHCLLTLIILDACVSLIAVPEHPFYAVAVVGLLLPMIGLNRWMYAT